MKSFGDYSIPSGKDEITSYYGQAALHLCHSALCVLPKPINEVKSFVCHPLALPAFDKFFKRIHDEKLWDCLEQITCYRGSGMRRTNHPGYSMHAFGAAIDLNEGLNPIMTKPMTEPPFEIKTIQKENPETKELMKLQERVRIADSGRFWAKYDKEGRMIDCHKIVAIGIELGFEWHGWGDKNPAYFQQNQREFCKNEAGHFQLAYNYI